MHQLPTPARSPPPASWWVWQGQAQRRYPAFARLPGLRCPHLPRKRMVPSTRVLPTNTPRAIRVPLLADFPGSMLLPVSASIGRDGEARQEESRRLWSAGRSQELASKVLLLFSGWPAAKGPRRKQPLATTPSQIVLHTNEGKETPQQGLPRLSPWPDKINSGCFIWVCSPPPPPQQSPSQPIIWQALLSGVPGVHVLLCCWTDVLAI